MKKEERCVTLLAFLFCCCFQALQNPSLLLQWHFFFLFLKFAYQGWGPLLLLFSASSRFLFSYVHAHSCQ